MEENKEVKVEEIKAEPTVPEKGFSWGFWGQQTVAVGILSVVGYGTFKLVKELIENK